MHKTLERQINRIYGSVDQIPEDAKPLVHIIDKTYEDYDKEHDLIERSLEISSKELTELNEKLRNEIEATESRAKKLEDLNEMMIDREIKMVELKKEIKELKEEKSN